MEEKSQIRRPLLLLAGSLWLVCLIYLLKMSVILIFFIFLILFRLERRMAVCVLILLVILAVRDQVPDTQVRGEALIQTARFMDEKRWDVRMNGKKYLYQGNLTTSGIYTISAQVASFSEKRTITGFQELSYYRSLGYEARIVRMDVDLENARALPMRIRLQNAAYRAVQGYGREQDFAYAFLFGGTQRLDPLYMRLFKQVGILHLLVVSGMHLKIYADFLRRLMKVLFIPRYMQMVILWCVFAMLCLLTDFHVSCLRSFLLVMLRDVLFMTRRRLDEIEQLSMVSLVLLILNPYYAVTFSFILGTLAHGALLFPKKPSLIYLYLCLLPFQLFFQGEVSILYMLFNVLMGLVMDLLLPVMLSSIVVRFLQPMLSFCLQGLLFILDQLREIDVLKFRFILLHPYSMVVVVLLLITLINQAQSRQLYAQWKRWGTLIVLSGMAAIFVIQAVQFGVWNRGVHFLDVGQGDAALIITEKGRSLLIDTGNSEDLLAFLRYHGIDVLDALFITHRDADHSSKMSELTYRKLYTSKYTALPEAILLKKGDRLRFDDVHIEVLSPEYSSGEENRDSLVLRLQKDDRNYLFAGDVPADLLQKSWFTAIDVFKFPHHGAKSSLDQDLLQQKDIPWIILSYGRNNYGHPAPEVLSYFSAQQVHETYKRGSLHFRRTGVHIY